MARACRLVRDGSSVDATWRRDADDLIVLPDAGAPLSLPLGEVSAIAGDGFCILLRSPLGDLDLERLGADGPTLLQDLRRDWPPIRARMLRLSDGSAPAQVFAGQVHGPGGSGPFRGFLTEDRFLYAIDGADVTALPLAECRSVAFDAVNFQVRCADWDSRLETGFSKLGGQTQALAERLRTARSQLTAEADASLARHLPSLAMAGRASLSRCWLPGRLLNLAELEGLAPGFEAAFRASWLAHSHRAEQGAALLQGMAPADSWLGYARPDRTLAPGEASQAMPQLLWLLVKGEPTWSLELLSQGDHATYLFTGGAELPGLVGGIVQLPEFSREALYLPMTDLVEQRSRYATAARELPLLRDLRRRFAGRRIHPPRARPAP
jgi:hypothetical protein